MFTDLSIREGMMGPRPCGHVFVDSSGDLVRADALECLGTSGRSIERAS